MRTEHRHRLTIVLILGFLATVSPFSIDMYLSAFPEIAADLNSSIAEIALSLSSYFIGLAAGQLIYGPCLDRYGRKRPIYIGLSIFIAATIGCAQSQSADMLIFFRFIQALGGGIAQIGAISMVRDFFPVKESAKILSFLVLVIGVSPLLAPTVGSFVALWLGWQWVFIILAVIVLVIMAMVAFLLPSPRGADPTISLKIGPIMRGYSRILKTPQFYTYAIAGAFCFAGLFVYVTGSPIIFMNVYGVSPQEYSGIFALLSVGFIGGSQLNLILLRRYSNEGIFRVGLFGQTIFALVLMVGTANHWYGLMETIILFFGYILCIGIISPNGTALAIAPFTRHVGSASSLLGFLQISIGAAISSCIGIFKTQDTLPIAVLMTVTGVCGVVILAIGRHRIANQPPGLAEHDDTEQSASQNV